MPIAFVSLYIRRKLDETPEFREVLALAKEDRIEQTPLRDAVRYYWRDMLRAIGLGAGQRIGSYTIHAYFVTALISAGFPTSLALLASMLSYVLSFPPEVRSSAAALNFNIGTSLIGSTAGLIAVWLHGLTGTDVAFGWYMTAACVVSILVAIFALPPSVDYREPDWNKAAPPTRVPA